MAAHSSCQGTVRAPAGVTLEGTSVTTGQAAAAQLPTREVSLAAAHWLVDLAAVACTRDLQYSASAVIVHIQSLAGLVVKCLTASRNSGDANLSSYPAPNS